MYVKPVLILTLYGFFLNQILVLNDMSSPRHHKSLLLLSPPPPPILRGVVITVTCDGIAKEQRGDSGVYATRLYNMWLLCGYYICHSQAIDISHVCKHVYVCIRMQISPRTNN